MRRKELFIAGVILLISVLILGLMILLRDEGGSATVKVHGELIVDLPLSRDTRFDIIQDGKTTNVLHIKDGEAYITDADCPDKLCERMGRISKNGESIVCLPNAVVVEIEGGENSPVDGRAQ